MHLAQFGVLMHNVKFALHFSAQKGVVSVKGSVPIFGGHFVSHLVYGHVGRIGDHIHC